MAPYGPEADAQPMPWDSAPVPPGPYPAPTPDSIDYAGTGQPGPGDADFALPPWAPTAPPDLASIVQDAHASVLQQPWEAAAPHVAIGMPTIDDYMAQQFRLHGAPPEPVNVGASSDPMPWEEATVDPTVAAYEPGADGLPWDAAHAPGGVEPGLAGSETFAPERDPNPEGYAADQAWAAEQASQDRIDKQAAEYDRLDPIAFADMQAKRQLKADAERATLELQNAETDRQALEDDIKRRQTARAMAQRDMNEVTTAARDMADGSPFANWWADRTVPQQVTGIFATIFAGLDNPRGPNSALDGFMKLADADTDQKWKKLEARRGLAQDAMGNADEDYKMRESIRLASMLQMQRAVEQQLARLDPEGSAAMKLSEVHRGVAAQMNKAAQELETLRFDRADKIVKADQEQQKIDNQLAKDLEAQRLARVKAARAAAPAPASLFGKDARYTREQWATIPGIDAARLPPDIKLSYDEVDKILGLQGKTGQMGVDAARGEGIGQENAARIAKRTIADPRRPGVDLGVAKTEKQGEMLSESLPKTIQAMETIDEMIRIMDTEGGASDLVKNANWQRLTGNEAYLGNLVRVAQHMGAYDAGVAKLAEDMRGGVNSKSFIRDATAGLKNLKKNIARGSELELGAAGLKPYVFPDLSAPTPAPRDPAADKLAGRGGPAVAPPSGPLDRATFDERARNLPPALRETQAFEEARRSAPDPLFDPAGARGISADQNDGLEQLIQGALTGDIAAARSLRAAALNNDLRPNVRAAAAAAFGKLVLDGNRAAIDAATGGGE